jgi:hypothetical protein
MDACVPARVEVPMRGVLEPARVEVPMRGVLEPESSEKDWLPGKQLE